MTYTYIVNPETGEILFDLVHDLITQNIRAIKLIAKKLNAVLRQKREQNMTDISVEIKAEGLDELKKLLNEALDQVEQLKNTLTRINKIKIRVDSEYTRNQQFQAFLPTN